MQRATDMLKDVSREENEGYELNRRKSPEAKAADPVKKDKSDESEIADNYEDDFDDDIEEDLPPSEGSADREAAIEAEA